MSVIMDAPLESIPAQYQCYLSDKIIESIKPYHVRASNFGIIKTPDAYLVRVEKRRFSLIPYADVQQIYLDESVIPESDDGAYIDLVIDWKYEGAEGKVRIREFILTFLNVYYLDSPAKRAAARFFGSHFRENEFSCLSPEASR